MSTNPEDNSGDYPTRPINPNDYQGGNGGDLAPDALRHEQEQIAGRILGVDQNVAAQRSSVVEGTNAIYVQGNEGAVIVAPDRTHLFARGDVSKNDHVAGFWDGQRGNYQPPAAEPVEEEPKTNQGVVVGGVILILAAIAALVTFLLLGDDEDGVDDVDVDPEPTQTAEPTEEPSPTATETETADPEPTDEPAPTVTETETAEPEPTEEETQPTEEPPTNGEDDAFNPANVNINTGGTFTEDEPNTVTGSGFMSNETLEVYLTEVDLGDVTTDDNGDFETEITIEGPFADQTTDMFFRGPASEDNEMVESVELQGSMEDQEG